MIEKERKFLLKNPDKALKHLKATTTGTEIKQAYLLYSAHTGDYVRVRLTQSVDGGGSVSKLGYKKVINKTDRYEYETSIPLQEGVELFNSAGVKLTKVRYTQHVIADNMKQITFDYDFYPNGLAVVEVEYDNPGDFEPFKYAHILGKEITGVKEYSNINIAIHGEPKI